MNALSGLDGTRWTGTAELRLDPQPLLAAVDDVLTRHIGPGTLAIGAALSDADLLRKLAEEAGLSHVDIEQVEHRIRVAEPETFVAMLMQAGAAVLQAIAELSHEERQSLSGRMSAELDEAIKPLMEDDRSTTPRRVS